MTTNEIAKRLRKRFYRDINEDLELSDSQRGEIKRNFRRYSDECVIDSWLDSHSCPSCRKPLFIALAMAKHAKNMREWIDLLQVPTDAN